MEDRSFFVAFDGVFSKLAIALVHDTPFWSNSYYIACTSEKKAPESLTYEVWF